MAAAGQMAEFFATLGVKIDKSDIQKVDKTLDYIEKRARKMTEDSLGNIKVTIGGFRFSEGFNTRLYKTMQKKMSILNNKKGLSPEIKVSKFDVDKNALLREMRTAVEYVESNLRVRVRPDVQRPVGGARGASGGRNQFGTGLGVGAAAGGLGRGFIPGLGLAFGVSQMNKINQELIGQDLAATAVFGNQEKGQEQLDWLRNLGNQIGFDYRSQANPYMKMAAAGTTAGMGTGQVQEIFQSMAEYGRVMGLNDEDMKGSMRAVEQMLNKGQVYAEELKMQLGEKFPAAIQLMAEAVAEGDTEKLFDMMEKGEVGSIEALPKFAKILSRQARVGGALTEAMKTSLAEQMRFNNAFNDMVMVFSEAGFEEGQAGIFQTMNVFLKNMTPLIESFGEAWKYVGDIIRVPLGLLHDLGVGIEGLSKYTGMAKGEITALGAVIGLVAFPLTRMVTIVTGALAVLEDFTGFLAGRRSLLGHLLGDNSEEVRNKFLSVFESVTSTANQLYSVIESIIDLFSDTDLPLVNVIKGLLDNVERTFELLNAALGGKSKEQRQQERAAMAETNPHIRQAMLSGVEKKGYGQNLGNAAADMIEGNPLMVVPDSLGVDNLIRNLANYKDNMEADEANRQDRMSMFRSGVNSDNSTSSNSTVKNYYTVGDVKFEASGNPETDANNLQDHLKRTSDAYQGSAD